MGKAKNLNVVSRNEGWVIRKEDAVKATSVHETQRAAVDAARSLQKGKAVKSSFTATMVVSESATATDRIHIRPRTVRFCFQQNQPL